MSEETFQPKMIGDRMWMKIKEDDAFESILEGFDAYRPYFEKIPNKRVAVQAGGYCGVFPRLLGEMFDTVYTFEPDATNFYCLVNNCYDNHIIKSQAALGFDHSMVTVQRQLARNRGMNVVKKMKESIVPVYRIDDLALPFCDLIQLDTEGYEMQVILGAEQTIKLFRPMICLEDTTKEIDDFLFGYHYNQAGKVHRDTIYTCGK